MEEINLIRKLEKISSNIPNRLLKVEGYLFTENKKEQLEIIIFKGFSSSTTHSIEIDLDKEVIQFDHLFTNFKLYKGPLNQVSDTCIRENKSSYFFLNPKNWN
tara:strand:- start:94 stop:402 length:309 start_codon:yes stop_codon:yes gene_type:complete